MHGEKQGCRQDADNSVGSLGPLSQISAEDVEKRGSHLSWRCSGRRLRWRLKYRKFYSKIGKKIKKNFCKGGAIPSKAVVSSCLEIFKTGVDMVRANCSRGCLSRGCQAPEVPTLIPWRSWHRIKREKLHQ